MNKKGGKGKEARAEGRPEPPKHGVMTQRENNEFSDYILLEFVFTESEYEKT